MSTPAAAAPAPTPAEGPGLSQGARIINAFIDPSKTFTDIRRNASWWMPWLLMAIFSYALVGAVAQKVGWEQVVQNQIHQSPKRAEQMDNMPADQRARALSVSVTVNKVIAYGIPLVNLIVMAIIAAVLMATFNFALGAEIPFSKALAVMMYSWLPSIVKAVLAVVSLYAGASPEGFNFENPVASNLGAFVDMTTHPALFKLAAAFDIFAIWILVLQGIGFASISKVKRGASMGVVFGWYAVITLIGVGFAAAFS